MFTNAMTIQEAEKTLAECVTATEGRYEALIIDQPIYGGYGVFVSLQPKVGLGYHTMRPMTSDEWRAQIAQCFIDSEILAQKDEARSRETGEPIWYKQQR